MVPSPWKIVTGTRIWNSELLGKIVKHQYIMYLSALFFINFKYMARQTPVYVAEITPKNIRGGFSAAHQVSSQLNQQL